jgi:phosphoglycolate phosphatase
VSEASIEAIIGPPLLLGFEALLEQQGRDRHAAPDCVRYYRALYREAAVPGTVLQPGVRSMLEELDQKLSLAVATSKPLVFAEPILRALGIRDAFEVVAGPTPELDGETKTQILGRAIRLLESRSGDAILRRSACMIGDRSHDIVGALENGVIAIGVTWGYGSHRELVEAGADFILTAPAQLPHFLQTANVRG